MTFAPARSAVERSAFSIVAFEKFTPRRLANWKETLRSLASVKSAPGPIRCPLPKIQPLGSIGGLPPMDPDFTPVRLARLRSAPASWAFSRFAPLSEALLKFFLDRFKFLKSALAKFALGPSR